MTSKNYSRVDRGARIAKYGVTTSLLPQHVVAIDKLTAELGEGRSHVIRMLIGEALAARARNEDKLDEAIAALRKPERLDDPAAGAHSAQTPDSGHQE